MFSGEDAHEQACRRGEEARAGGRTAEGPGVCSRSTRLPLMGERTGRLCASPASEIGRTHFTGEDRAGQQPVGLQDSPVTTELNGLS